MWKIKCINRWFVLKPNNSQAKTEGGILLPDEVIERNPKGVVMEVADKWMDSSGVLHESDFANGEEVFYNASRGVPIVEKDILEAYGIQKDEEMIYLLFEDVYFISKENAKGKKKRKLILEKND